MFAVVRIQGKQYKVKKGDQIEVDRLDGEVGDSLKLTDVLLVDRDGTVEVGTPTVKGTVVQAKILEQKKGDKINVRRYRSKSRHRRSIGFRAQLTTLEVSSIGSA